MWGRIGSRWNFEKRISFFGCKTEGQLSRGRRVGQIHLVLDRLSASVAEAVSVRFALRGDMLTNFEAFQISKKFYQKCKTLKIPRFLQDQLLRASSSIGLNLAEGSAKRTPADQRIFYGFAYGSLRECQGILELEDISDVELNELANKLGAILYTSVTKG